MHEEIEKKISALVSKLFEKKAFAKIYLYLFRHPKSDAESIILGTKLHPSTVRDALAKMHGAGEIMREKGKTATVGKKPYIYNAVALREIAKKRIREIEKGLNSIIRSHDKEMDILENE